MQYVRTPSARVPVRILKYLTLRTGPETPPCGRTKKKPRLYVLNGEPEVFDSLYSETVD